MVRIHNTHRCSTSINGCKKDINAKCKHGYSRGETVSETFVNKVTNRVFYWRRTKNGLLIVPYNLQMMMDWDSHNVEYSGSAYCALYIYKYCYKGAARKERIDFSPEQEHDSYDKINCSYTGGSCLLWLQFGECIDIRIIYHQIHRFVLSRFSLEINWTTLKDEVMSLIYKYIIVNQRY